MSDETKQEQTMTESEWFQIGRDRGWISESFCCTHEGPPMVEAEFTLEDRGHDLCCFCVRVGNREEWEQDALGFARALGEEVE